MKQFITRFRLYSLILLFALLGVQQASANYYLHIWKDPSKFKDIQLTQSTTNSSEYSVTLRGSDINSYVREQNKLYFLFNSGDNTDDLQKNSWYSPASTTYYLNDDAATFNKRAANVKGVDPQVTLSSDWSSHSFTFKIVVDASNNLQVTVTDPDVAQSGYWLVSKELTGGKLLDSYRFTPSRVRNGGTLSTVFYSLNKKTDELLKKITSSSFTYHIERVASGTKTIYQAKSNNEDLGSSTSAYQYGTNVQQATEMLTTTSSSSYNSFTLTPSLSTPRTSSDVVSYTWLLNANSKELKIIKHTAISEGTNKTMYVIGNFASAKASVKLEPWDKASVNKMTRRVYYKGKTYSVISDETWDANKMDSVVYRVIISKPAEGWGQLYLGAITGNNLGTENSNGTITLDKQQWTDAQWSTLIRPMVQDDNNSTEGGNSEGYDATAIEGGLFVGNGISNKNQAINPQLDANQLNASSYTFQINVTTSTYRILFNEGDMYIMGPAISGTDNDWSTDLSHTVNAIKMTWDGNDQCFKILDDNGNEKAITLNNGKGFRFAYGKKFTNTWFGEDLVTAADAHIPADLSDGTKAYTAQAPNYDTQYVNYLTDNRSTGDNYTDTDSSHDITFNLPTRTDYKIRLYLRKIGTEEKAFYTINRGISFSDFSSVSGNPNGYKYFRSFSEWHAMRIPDGVKAYIVTAVDPVKVTATLTEIKDYIPARTGVILATNNESDPTEFETYAEDPEITTISSNTTDVTNLLTAQMASATIPYYGNGTVGKEGTYNYLFGVPMNTSSKNYKLGFFMPNDNHVSKRNVCYLNSNVDVRNSTSAAKQALGFFLSLDDTTTGINTLPTVATDKAPYYTLSGSKVAKPTQPGLYIHEGKKIVIR